MNKEYIIWGKTNPQEEEKILLTKIDNNLITDKTDADKALKLLEKKYSCTECRIQEIDLSYPNNLNSLFTKTINK